MPTKEFTTPELTPSRIKPRIPNRRTAIIARIGGAVMLGAVAILSPGSAKAEVRNQNTPEESENNNQPLIPSISTEEVEFSQLEQKLPPKVVEWTVESLDRKDKPVDPNLKKLAQERLSLMANLALAIDPEFKPYIDHLINRTSKDKQALGVTNKTRQLIVAYPMILSVQDPEVSPNSSFYVGSAVDEASKQVLLATIIVPERINPYNIADIIYTLVGYKRRFELATRHLINGTEVNTNEDRGEWLHASFQMLDKILTNDSSRRALEEYRITRTERMDEIYNDWLSLSTDQERKAYLAYVE